MKFTLRNGPIEIPFPFVRGRVGLGTAIKKATSAAGLTPCTPCQKRAEMLDRLAVIRGEQPESKKE